MAHDLVIRNGLVVDGTGAEPVRADVAIDGDRITGVGEVDGRGTREIDAADRYVTPGFVDIHTHLDAQLAWDPIGSSSCWHGVTSVVLGNCGVTFAPCKPGDRQFLAEMMESVEDIPADSIMAGLAWDWESYGEYLDAVDRMPKGVNAGGMVGHCAVRIHAMGERGLDQAPATDEDVDRDLRARRRGDRRRRARLLHLAHRVAPRARRSARARYLRRRARAHGDRPRDGRPAPGRVRERSRAGGARRER